VNRLDIKELHYITHIDNLESILQHGIMSHNKAKRLPHISVSDPEVQTRRSKIVIPPRYKLHDYVNLYFNARNPMMYRIVRKRNHKELVVLKIDVAILDINGVIIADKNASSDYVRFCNVSEGIHNLKGERVYARYWNDPDPIEKHRKTSEICAEVLIPDSLRHEYILGCYVSCQESLDRVKILLTGTHIANKVSINSDIFFQ
jgi:hypothetical protein